MHKFFGAVVIWIGIALWAGIGAGLAQPSENGLRPIATTTPYSSSASTPSSAAATRYFLPVVAQLQHAALPTSLPTPTAVPEGTATPAATSIAVNRRSPLGTNLPKLTNWEMLWTLDQAPLAGEWLTQCDESCGYTWNTGEQEQLVLDSDGWVISFGNNPARRFTHVALAYFNGGASVVPAGDWTVLYEGEATVDYGFSPFVTEIHRAPGRDVLRISPSDDDTLLRIRISDINPNNHLRNLHLIPPGGICDNDPFLYAENAADCGAGTFQSFVDVYPNVRFHPLMLQALQHYQVLRFMQWQGIVDDLEAKPWEERSLLGDAFWGTGWGVSPPIELIFELSNLLHADPWVHLPFWADDSYTRRFAELAFSQLDPARNLYLEYANEVWNNAYPYSLYGSQIEEWAQQRWPNVFHSDGSPASGYTKRMNFVGMRSAQICAIWHEVWGAAAERLRCIMPGGPWEFPAHEALSCPFYAAETGKPNCAEQMWAVAAAPYFGGYLDDNDNAAGGFFDQLAAWASSGPAGLDSLFQELRTGALLNGPDFADQGALAAAAEVMRANQTVADEFDLALVSYEGGQHLTPLSGPGTSCSAWNDAPGCAPYRAIQELFVAANRDPRMGALYTDYLNLWRQSGGTLFVHYTAVSLPSGQYGSWGAKESVLQADEQAPKYQALRSFIDNNPCWWTGCPPAAPSKIR